MVSTFQYPCFHASMTLAQLVTTELSSKGFVKVQDSFGIRML